MDVKPDNILLKDSVHPHAKLSDFGTAVHFRDSNEVHDDVVGTAQYCAPEVIRKSYVPKIADMWSAGMTLFCVLAGDPAYDGPYDELTMHRVLSDKLVLPRTITQNYSVACLNFLMSLLRRKVDHRMSVADALKHPWIQAGGVGAPEMDVPTSEDPAVGLHLTMV